MVFRRALFPVSAFRNSVGNSSVPRKETCCILRRGWGLNMILSKLAAATLVVGVAGSVGETPTHQLSLQQRDAATRAYVRSATDCIARTVVSDTRFRKDNPASNLGDLIVDSVPKCLDPVRAMIAAHD